MLYENHWQKYNENNGDKKRLVSETTDVKQEPGPCFR